MREGLLPDAFEKIYAPFANTITGTPIVQTDKVAVQTKQVISPKRVKITIDVFRGI